MHAKVQATPMPSRFSKQRKSSHHSVLAVNPPLAEKKNDGAAFTFATEICDDKCVYTSGGSMSGTLG